MGGGGEGGRMGGDGEGGRMGGGDGEGGGWQHLSSSGNFKVYLRVVK